MKILIDNKDNILYKKVIEGLKTDGLGNFNNDLTIGFFDDKENFLGGIIFFLQNKYNAHLSIYTNTPNWCSRKILKWLYDFCFNKLKVIKITCQASEKNKKSRDFLDMLGFRLEGTIRYDMKDGSHSFVYGLTKEEADKNKFFQQEK